MQNVEFYLEGEQAILKKINIAEQLKQAVGILKVKLMYKSTRDWQTEQQLLKDIEEVREKYMTC